jgi:hypothetical protein
MIKLTLTTTLPLGILLLCGGASRMRASGNTPITIKDGSIVLWPADLDAGQKWKIVGKYELRHAEAGGALSSVKITDGGADQCGGDAMCGIDPAKPWTIRAVYNGRWVSVSSVSANQGIHVKFSPKISFDQWKKTGNADEREFGHGDYLHISGIKVNGGGNKCSGKGSCAVTLIYTTP